MKSGGIQGTPLNDWWSNKRKYLVSQAVAPKGIVPKRLEPKEKPCHYNVL